MKIGILTFHRAHNYGAVLQCYALQEVLKSMGHNVWVIDYRQPWIEREYEAFSFYKLIKVSSHPQKMLYYIINIQKRILRQKKFYSFTSKRLNLTDPCYTILPQSFEIYIIGSDQLWGLQCIGNTVDKKYMGNFHHQSHSRIIGYAIGSTIKSLEKIGNKNLKNYIKNFSTISFREKEICQKVKLMTGIEVHADMDPTILADKTLWEKLINKKWSKEKYILLYQVRKPKAKSEKNTLNNKAMNLAQQMNCKVIDLSSAIYSPEDFISLFKYAQYVISSSFHATVFSLIFERPLYAVKLNDGYDGRYENLLKALGADKMLVNLDFSPIPLNIDYSQITPKIAILRKESLKHLKEI